MKKLIVLLVGVIAIISHSVACDTHDSHEEKSQQTQSSEESVAE